MSAIDPTSRRLRLVDCVAQSVVHTAASRIGPRYEHGLQMLLIHSGGMSVTIDDREPRLVEAGHICLLLPGHVERIQFVTSDETRQTLVRGVPLDLTDPMSNWLESLRPTRPLSAASTYIAREAVASERTRVTAGGALVDALATALLWRFVAEFETSPLRYPRPSRRPGCSSTTISPRASASGRSPRQRLSAPPT